ncbi:MAG TPA: hypothetical protein VEX43_18390 [Chthoniobacterales bacterium]|nr:hypothetical protein [Chthoniobacterales bacterium]
MRIANRLYAFIGWAIVALGGLHMLTTIRLSASTPAFRVWFFGAGLAMALGGALNLLHRAYGRSAPGLRVVCWIANILLTLLGAVAGALTGASIAEYILIMSLLGGALILSLNRSSLNAPQDSAGT